MQKYITSILIIFFFFNQQILGFSYLNNDLKLAPLFNLPNKSYSYCITFTLHIAMHIY